MGVIVFNPKGAGQKVTSADYNQQNAAIEPLMTPNTSGFGVEIANSSMGFNLLNQADYPLWTRIGESNIESDPYDSENGVYHAFQQVWSKGNGTVYDLGYDGTTGTLTLFPSIEISGRRDTPIDAVVQSVPYPTRQWFLHRWFPPCTIIENDDLVTATTIALTSGKTSVARLGSTYLNLPQEATDRVMFAVGSLSCYGNISGELFPPANGQDISCYAVISFQRFDADNPTESQERTGRSELIWAVQQTSTIPTITLQNFTVTGGTFAVSGGGGGTIVIPDQKFDSLTGTADAPVFNTIGIMAGSATCMISSNDIGSDSGFATAPLGGYFPDTIATKVNLDVYVRSVGYTGNIDLTFSGSSFPMDNHFQDTDGTTVYPAFKPMLRVFHMNYADKGDEPSPTPP